MALTVRAAAVITSFCTADGYVSVRSSVTLLSTCKLFFKNIEKKKLLKLNIFLLALLINNFEW